MLSMINFQTKSLQNVKKAQFWGVITNYADLNIYLFQELKPMEHPQEGGTISGMCISVSEETGSSLDRQDLGASQLLVGYHGKFLMGKVAGACN
jgi:hypothetical protein